MDIHHEFSLTRAALNYNVMQTERCAALQADLNSLLTSVSNATGLQRIELSGNTGITGPLAADDLCTIVQVEATSQPYLALDVVLLCDVVANCASFSALCGNFCSGLC